MTPFVGLNVSQPTVAIVCSERYRNVGGASRLPLDQLQAPASISGEQLTDSFYIRYRQKVHMKERHHFPRQCKIRCACRPHFDDPHICIGTDLSASYC